MTRRSRPGIRFVAAFAIAAVAMPAAAQDADRAAMAASLVGFWVGEGRQRNEQTDEMEPVEDAFSYAMLSDNGLDVAFWRADALTITEDVGDGMIRERTWVRGELVNDDTRAPGELTGPDANGDWTLVEQVWGENEYGIAFEQRIEYAFTDGGFSIRTFVRSAGSDADFHLVYDADYAKQE